MHYQIVEFLAVTMVQYCLANLLNNGDFHDDTSWKLQIRKSLWDLNHAEDRYLRIEECDQCKNKKGLTFSKLDEKLTLVASQYIPMELIHNPLVGKLAMLKATIQNVKGAESFQLRIDISYEDGRYLFVHDKIFTGEQFTCILIPQYGNIRAIMVHLVTKGETQDSVIIDSVSLETVPIVNSDPECIVYLKSKPKEREVMYDYFFPKTLSSKNQITLVTQFTEDRLDLFEETLKMWRGPAAATILMFNEGKDEALRRIAEKYYNYKYLPRYARIHIVNEDLAMKEDSTKYPVNFLRKVILNSTTTDYLFYVDADILPSFSHDTALKWLQEEADHINHKQAAFLAPLFHSSKGDPPLLNTKSDLLKALNESKLESFAVVSHSVVKYRTWYNSDHIYEVPYKLNMEPYFITHREAPLINEMFEGYGRDKCAYSKELHHAGFSFYVVPHGFLINRREPKSSKTILRRSGGVNLQVFLTTLFHDEDLRLGFLRHRQEPAVVVERPAIDACAADSNNCESEQAKELVYTEETNTDNSGFFDSINDDEEDDGGLSCRKLPSTKVDGELYPHQLNPLPNIVTHPQRIALTVESLIKHFAIGNFIHLPKEIDGQISLLIPYYHASAVVSVIPFSKESTFRKDISTLFTEYRSLSNSTTSLLAELKETLVDPTIYFIEMSGLQDTEAVSNLSAVLEYSTNNDVVVMHGSNLSPIVLMQGMCTKKKSWKLYMNDQYYFMKSSIFIPPHQVTFPALDTSTLRFKNGQIDFKECSGLKTDIFLFTKNRPLQSHAFIESLLQMVTGTNKLWLIVHSDNDDITLAYENLLNCFSHQVNIELIFDNQGFGRTVEMILHKSDADYIMMTVDEIIWLRPVNLNIAACLMNSLGEQIISFQLRLGDNLKFGKYKVIENQKTFIGQLGDEEIYGLYPLWQPFDFGYVTQVDGPIISKERLHHEIGPFLYESQHPGHIEGRWLRRFLHKHARSWHLMYGKSRLVNNKVGDRVTGSQLKESSLQLVDVYLKQNKVIDVEQFRSENLQHKHTHIAAKIIYKDLNCE